MSMTENELKNAARRAYEGGRWRQAWTTAAFAAPLILVSLFTCQERVYTLGAGAALIGSLAFFRWRGRSLGRGVAPGFAAGLVAFPLPFVSMAIAHPSCPSEGLCAFAMTVCVGGGAAAGVLLGRGVSQGARRRAVAAGAALWIALLVGSLSCIMLGMAGVAGLSVGLLIGTAPTLILTRPGTA